MNAAQLREIQAPLKQRYRDDPDAARTPFTAHADYRDTGVTCTVDGWSGPTGVMDARGTLGVDREASSTTPILLKTKQVGYGWKR